MRRICTILVQLTAAISFVLATAGTASAEIYGFSCITQNNAGDCSILESQIGLEVTSDLSLNSVHFRFTNTGPSRSTIAEVYFDDLLPPLLSAPAVITSPTGVRFVSGCSPGNVPGGNPLGFGTTYCAEGRNPAPHNGVNAGEWVDIAYTLTAGSTFADVIAALDSGEYRVGVHVINFGTGGSESGITTNRVPEPSSLLLLTMAAGLAPMLRRRRSRS